MRNVFCFLSVFVFCFSLLACTTFGKFNNSTKFQYENELYAVGNIDIGKLALVGNSISVRKSHIYTSKIEQELYIDYSSTVIGKERLLFNINEWNQLIESLSKYTADYQQKNFDVKQAKNESLYGVFDITYQWGGGSFECEANTKIRYGYKFINGKPYFTLTIDSGDNKYYSPDGINNTQYSGGEQLLINLSTVESLSELINVENVQKLLSEDKASVSEKDSDSY